MAKGGSAMGFDQNIPGLVLSFGESWRVLLGQSSLFLLPLPPLQQIPPLCFLYLQVGAGVSE